MSTLASVNGRGVNASRPAAGIAGQLYLSTDIGPGTWYRDNGSSWDAMATSNPMTTAGDTVYGGASGAPTRLAIGAAGAAKSVINGAVAWNSGTSFPASKLTGDRYWRTDLGLEAYWDGTQWLTTQLFREELGVSSSASGAGAVMPITNAGGQSIARLTPWATTYDLWLDAFFTSTFVNGTNNGTNYWTVALQKASAADAKTGIVSFNTSGDTASNWTQRRTSIAAVYTASAHREFDVQATPTLTPGTLFWALALSYRLILT